MANNRKIIVAVTGASGSMYARLLIRELLRTTPEELSELVVVFSANGYEVAKFEKWNNPKEIDDPSGRVRIVENDDMFDAIASGSAGYDAMVVVPCSMGTVGRLAAGVSADLIGRAADVMLKERRKLILGVRETPFSTIHLRNMTTLSECGAVIMPLSPSFYSHPNSSGQACMTVVERILSQLGIDLPRYEWGKHD